MKNGGRRAAQKETQKVKIIFFKFLFQNFIFFKICEALIHSIWTCDEKVMVTLGFRAM